METLIEFLSSHASKAHWIAFGCLLLAGLNIPVSIDVVLIFSAVLAATLIPENAYLLYGSVLFGCLFSAWISYSLGRFLGDKLPKIRFFSKILTPHRIQKLTGFYTKYGVWVFILGRFIPFGVRNCMFMTSGLSKMPFKTFVWRDAVACFIWTTVAFSSCYLIGQNFNLIWSYVKAFNLILFAAFSVTVITTIWYKLKKRRQQTANE